MENMFDETSATVWQFTVQLLEDITDNFSEQHVIGSGAYGSVYKGRLFDNGEEIAIKKLHYIPGLKGDEFENEFNNLMIVRHQNIVRLVGYCYHEENQPFFVNGRHMFAAVQHKFLCFEYLQRGSLDKHISDESCGLDWTTRYKIITGVCDGVNYLHNGTKDAMYHLDLKPENILLDNTMMPKIADFGLSRLFGSTQTCVTSTSLGTRGYMPPEYINRNEITPKFDVFSLGVIIIRIIAGNDGYPKCAYMASQEFIDLVHGNWEKRMQPTMSSHTSQEIKTCINIALECVEIERAKRPTIAEIIDELKKIGASFETFQSQQELGNFPVFKKVPYMPKRLPKSKVTDFRAKQFTSTDNSGVQFDTMRFDDDGPIPIPPFSGKGAKQTESKRVQLVIRNNKEAPLDENYQQVILELIGGDTIVDSPGLDLVAVLDVSSSMNGEKMEKMKTAMIFIVHKLRPMDRVSVVTFSNAAERHYPLRLINEISQQELKDIIDGLVPGAGTNMEDGLRTGLKTLADRKVKRGRLVGIMLMSDGQENESSHAAQVAVGNVPVYTFGFGEDFNPMVLHSVAGNSMGGMFSSVEDIGSLTMALSQCLAGPVSLMVKDLKLTVACSQYDSMIQKVTAGHYPQTQDDYTGSVTVSFGDLYSREVRRVIVDLYLIGIQSERCTDILKITYSHSASGRLFNAPPTILTVRRTGTAVAKETCLQKLDMISEPSDMVDGMKLEVARGRLVEAQSMLDSLTVEQSSSSSNPLLQDLVLKESGGMCLRLFATPRIDTNLEQARLFAKPRMDTQLEQPRLFATPRMDTELEQPKLFLTPRMDTDLEQCKLLATPHMDTELEQPRLFATPRTDTELEQPKLFVTPHMDTDLEQPKLFATPRMDTELEQPRLFATPRMDTELEQPKLFTTPRIDTDLEQSKLLATPHMDTELEQPRLFATPRMDTELEQPKLFATPRMDTDLEQPKLFATPHMDTELEQPRLFATPRMDTELEQPKLFATPCMDTELEQPILFATPRMDTELEQLKLFVTPRMDTDLEQPKLFATPPCMDTEGGQPRLFATPHMDTELEQPRLFAMPRMDTKLEQPRLFATPRMETDLEQPRLFATPGIDTSDLEQANSTKRSC